MAAGTSSRFVPLSLEIPKGLLEVKGEILIERQIRQLHEAGITNITIVAGYQAEKFKYLIDRFGVDIVINEDYARYNNTSSLIRVLDRLGDTYICCSDNYFPKNVFIYKSETGYYSAKFASGKTDEYCLSFDKDLTITDVRVGGEDSWYMVGHVYFHNEFSEAFKKLLASEYSKEEIRKGYWEDLYIKNIKSLPPLKVKQYSDKSIEEFDSLDELRQFDSTYIKDTRSSVLKSIARRLDCGEDALSGFRRLTANGQPLRFSFIKDSEQYVYCQSDDTITRL